ncbi:PilZ domain-containing protein [Breoghania sp.]|nr:PilZ domain-containing protein [Breoghania sp.]
MDGENRRKSHRRRMLQGGKIVYGRSALLIDCMIRDLSEEGARLKVSNARDVPDNIRLFNSGEKTIIDATVMWRSPREVGVQFTGRFQSVIDDPDPKIRNLRFND